MGFDGYTIHRVHIKEQNRVIRVKDLRIYEDTIAKGSSALPGFEGKPTFDGIQLSEEEKLPSSNSDSSDEGKDAGNTSKRATKTRARRTVKPIPKSKDKGKAAKGNATVEEETQALIVQLTQLLDQDWEQNTDDKFSAFLATCLSTFLIPTLCPLSSLKVIPHSSHHLYLLSVFCPAL